MSNDEALRTWRCNSCQHPNSADAALCVRCGIAASLNGEVMDGQTSEPSSSASSPEALEADPWAFVKDPALFFPEGILAAITVLFLPVWVGRLLYNGAFATAALLSVLGGLGIALCVAAWREKNKWVLYAGVLCILGGALTALPSTDSSESSCLHQTQRCAEVIQQLMPPVAPAPEPTESQSAHTPG